MSGDYNSFNATQSPGSEQPSFISSFDTDNNKTLKNYIQDTDNIHIIIIIYKKN